MKRSPTHHRPQARFSAQRPMPSAPQGLPAFADLRSTVSRLALTSALVGAAALSTGTARAADECGPGVIVICQPAGNPYASGITYSSATSGLNVSFAPGVAVNTTADSTRGLSVSITSATDVGPIVIDTRQGSIVTDGQSSAGISATSLAGSVQIMTGNVTTTGQSANAIEAVSSGNGTMVVDTRGGTIRTGGLGATGILLNGGGAMAISLHTADVTTTGEGGIGVSVQNYGTGSTLIDTTAGTVSTSGATNAGGIIVYSGDGSLTIRTAGVSTAGTYASAIAVEGYGAGAVEIDTTAGAITTLGSESRGIAAVGYSGGTVTIRTANISTAGSSSGAIVASSFGGGAVLVDTTAARLDPNNPAIGGIRTTGDGSSGILVVGGQVPGTPAAPITIRTGDVLTRGEYSSGIASYGGAAVSIDTSGALVSTSGAQSHAIAAFSVRPETVADIQAGRISTTGPNSFGIAVSLLTAPTNYFCDDTGCYPDPASVTNSGAATITANGPIVATGKDAGGIVAVSFVPSGWTSGPITVNANANITASGQNAVGIAAASGNGPVTINVASGVSVMGGWAASPGDRSSVPPTPAIAGVPLSWIGGNLQAAGIVIYSGATGASPAMTINNSGTVGAWSDQAVAMGYVCSNSENGLPQNDPCTGGMPAVRQLYMMNQGTVQGYISFLPGAAHTVDNSGLFDVRHFADTNGDGMRDTKRVAISDFGGPGATFNNLASGTVKLATVTGAPIVDSTGYYVPTTGSDRRPLDGATYSLFPEGVVQGQFVNLATFNNQGTIDLRGLAVGNTFVITGGPGVVNGTLQPGGGTFVTGGNLYVNTVLNGGMAPGGAAGSQSDMLIVDSTRIGTGPTTINVTNVGGTGAPTPGNGIELVEVLNKAASAAGAFALQGQFATQDGRPAIVAGAFAYSLYQGGVGADASDGNWYLRSQLNPTPPGPNPPDPTPPQPRYNPGVPVYETYGRVLLGMNGISTLEQRVGTRYAEPGAVAPAVPMRVFCKDAARNFICDLTPDQRGYYQGQGEAQGQANNATVGWMRLDAAFGQFQPAYSRSNTSGNTDMQAIEGGFDALLHQGGDARLFGGVLFRYGYQSVRVNSPHGDGRIGIQGYGLGATLTWYGANDVYVDGQARATWYRSSLRSDLVGANLAGGENAAFGYAFSVEVGRKFALTDRWSLTPQVQLAYSQVRFDRFTDPFGAQVSLPQAQSLLGRLGLAATYETRWRAENGQASATRLYGIANLYYEFLNGAVVEVAGERFAQRNDRLWAGLGLGANYSWNNGTYTLFGEASANSSLQQFGASYLISGKAGLRVRF